MGLKPSEDPAESNQSLLAFRGKFREQYEQAVSSPVRPHPLHRSSLVEAPLEAVLGQQLEVRHVHGSDEHKDLLKY